MKKLIAYCGKLGSGKNYQMMKEVDNLKDTGHTIYLISFADPIKKILRDSFGFTKAGKIKKEYPEFTKLYVKTEIVNSLYLIIKELQYEKFDIHENDLKAFIEKNYERYESEFYPYIWGAEYGIWMNEPVEYNFAFRKLGQMLGTELARNVVDSIWVDTAIDKVKKVFKSNLADYAFCPDLRFVNELQTVQDFKNTTVFDSEVFGVVASDETRATRRGLTMDELKAQDTHGSETSIDEIISKLPKENVIENN